MRNHSGLGQVERELRDELRRQEEHFLADAQVTAAAWLTQREAHIHADADARLAAAEAQIRRAAARVQATDLYQIRRRHFATAAAAELAAARAEATAAAAIGAAVSEGPAALEQQRWLGGWEGRE